MEETSVFEKIELQLDQSAKDFLKGAAKWAYFLSVIGYVWIGLLALSAFFTGVSRGTSTLSIGSLSGITEKGIVVIYLIVIIINFFPVYYLNRFAVTVKKAFKENDMVSLSDSFKYLKFHFKYIVVFITSFVLLYVLITVGVVIFVFAR